MDETETHAILESKDSDFHTGAVENNRTQTKQILPVWASSEPFGYTGSIADQQVVGGGDELIDADAERSERESIGPEGG
jgi:hypothetical protein